MAHILVNYTRTPPVEAALVVTYLQFPIQVCFPCIGQLVTDTASVIDNLVVVIIVMVYLLTYAYTRKDGCADGHRAQSCVYAVPNVKVVYPPRASVPTSCYVTTLTLIHPSSTMHCATR